MRTLVFCSVWLILIATGTAASPTPRALARYEKLLANSPGGLAAEVRLAKWCEQRGLDDRAEEHWLRTLCLDAQNERALKSLELGVLFEPSHADPELQQAQREAVARLVSIGRPPSNFVLAWHSLYSAEATVREASRAALETKPLEDYVPILLSSLSLPLEMGVSTQLLGNRVLNHYTFERERPDGTIAQSSFSVARGIPQSKLIAAFGKTVAQSFVPERTVRNQCGGLLTIPAHLAQATTGVYPQFGTNPQFVAQASRATQLADQDKAITRAQLSRLNQTIGQQNRLIIALLRQSTGVELSDRPKDWWRWWQERYDSDTANAGTVLDGDRR